MRITGSMGFTYKVSPRVSLHLALDLDFQLLTGGFTLRSDTSVQACTDVSSASCIFRSSHFDKRCSDVLGYGNTATQLRYQIPNCEPNAVHRGNNWYVWRVRGRLGDRIFPSVVETGKVARSIMPGTCTLRSTLYATPKSSYLSTGS